jgi:hypothetical protein
LMALERVIDAELAGLRHSSSHCTMLLRARPSVACRQVNKRQMEALSQLAWAGKSIAQLTEASRPLPQHPKGTGAACCACCA